MLEVVSGYHRNRVFYLLIPFFLCGSALVINIKVDTRQAALSLSLYTQTVYHPYSSFTDQVYYEIETSGRGTFSSGIDNLLVYTLLTHL